MKEEKGSKLSLIINYILLLLFIFKIFFMPPKRTGPQVKHCPQIALPAVMTQAPPPPHTDLPAIIDDIPTTTVMLKTAPLPPPPCSALPKKKRTPGKQSPFFPGVYGRPLFTLTPVNHYSAILNGKSIIFNYFRKALPHEVAEGSSYILVDIYENLWVAPEVFLKWREAVDTGAMKDPEKSVYRFSITHIGNEYCLYWLLKKDSIQAVHHPAPPPYSALPKGDELDDDDDDDKEAFPTDNNESDSDFEPNKK